MTAAKIRAELKSVGNPAKAKDFEKFYQAYPGGYGEGDKFFVISVPTQRKIAKQYRDAPLAEIVKLLNDPYHECRLTALFILVEKYQRGDQSEKDKIVSTYLKQIDRINNWDLVDSAAHKILGAHLVGKKDRKILYELADSGMLWRQRVAIVACFTLIKEDDFKDILKLSQKLLLHEHDLIHKAIGWMLREMGKRDVKVLEEFLAKNYQKMPRTMLRYAIEKFEEKKRKAYLQGTV